MARQNFSRSSRFSRLLRHWWARLVSDHGGLGASELSRIEAAITQGEASHDAEVRFVVEAGLSAADISSGLLPRERAIAVFAQLGVWDTENNNGVMLYICSADHAIELIADRGVVRRVPQVQWDAICQGLSNAYRSASDVGARTSAIVSAIAQVHAILAGHYPPRVANPDELSNKPVLL
jgi:uncharacterized membrane protein